MASAEGLVAEPLRAVQSLPLALEPPTSEPPTLEVGPPGEDLSRLQDHLVSPTVKELVPSVDENSSKCGRC